MIKSSSFRLIIFLFIFNFGIISVYSQNYQWGLTSCPSAVSRFDDLSFINDQRGWVIDFMGGLYKTEDGGNSWNTMTGPPSTVYRSVLFLDSLHGFIGLLGSLNPDSAVLYQTFNGGDTWAPVSNFPYPLGSYLQRGGICGMCKVEDSVIYACGKFWGPSFVYRSGDYGQSWQRFDMGAQAFGLVDIYFWSRDSGIVVGSVDTSTNAIYANAAIFRTTNGGFTWQQVYQSQLPEEWCWKISVPSSGVFYVAVEQYSPGSRYILKSMDFGQTWTELNYANYMITTPPTNGIVSQGIGFRTVNEGWVAINSTNAISNSFYHTLDGGLSWSPQNVEFGINRFRFINDSTGYASGLHVFKLINTIQSLPEHQHSEMNISPVITSGQVTIRFSDASEKLIRVLSAEGALVKTIILKGTEHLLDLSFCKAGAYFILATSDKYYASEKFLLMK